MPCRGSFIGGLILAVILAAAPAEAQTPKIQLRVQPKIKLQVQPRVVNTLPPRINIAPAVTRAIKLNPGSTAVKAIRLPNGGVKVTLKQGNELKQVVITP